MKDKINKTIVELFSIMDLPLDQLEVEEQERSYVVSIKTDRHASLLIGRGGQNLLALQHLLRMMISRQMTNPVPIVIDINDYRAKQREELLQWVEGIAAEVVERGEPVRLEPMSGYDRRLIHLHLADHPKVVTESEGDEPERMVVIKVKNQKSKVKNDENKK